MSNDLDDALTAARSFIHDQHPPNLRMGMEKLLEAVELIALQRPRTQRCCAGGPQWGHAWDCPKCPD
jgi:hypothetical protein